MTGYDVNWDRPHAPEANLAWQESDAYWFYDHNTGVGGFHRIGQKPNINGGQIILFAFARNGKRYAMNYYDTVDFDLKDGDRWESGYRVGTQWAEALGNGRMQFGWEESDSSANLEFYDQFHEPQAYTRRTDTEEFIAKIGTGGHLDVAGRLRGRIRLGDESYEIDALAHRDRSWGFRDFSQIEWHRFRLFSGTVGEKLSFIGSTVDVGGQRAVRGYVARNGKIVEVRDMRVAVTLDYDGYTTLGARGTFDLVNGETISIACRALQGVAVPMPGTFSIETMAELEYEGEQGFAEIVQCTNPGRGGYYPRQADVSLLAVDPGLSDSQTYPTALADFPPVDRTGL